jgi:hypothetical protein
MKRKKERKELEIGGLDFREGRSVDLLPVYDSRLQLVYNLQKSYSISQVRE